MVGQNYRKKNINMNRVTLTVSILVFLTLLSCNRTDFTNPEEVIKSYRTLMNENKNEKLYEEFLSNKSKEFVTKDEFLKARTTPDSIQKTITVLERNISGYPIDVNNPTYRRFKVDEKRVIKNDTIRDRFYYTLLNENGNWKVVWTSTLLTFAQKKYADGNYSEARKTLEKIIEIDPFSGITYNFLAWSYYRDPSLTRNEWENGVVKNAKYAVTLEEEYPEHYNTLAAYYSAIGNNDLAIQNFERGLSYCLNDLDKTTFYSNLVGCYMEKRKFDKAEEYVKKSIEINDNDAFVWFKYGALMQTQNKFDKAIEYYEQALKKDKMENSLQGSLYYSYSEACFKKGKCDIAMEYINKALDIEPNNYGYQSLYSKLKYCK